MEISLFRNKKGGEKYLSFWWFLVLIMVGTGVVVGTWLFHGAEIDINGPEAQLLHDKIIMCIVDDGVLKLEVLDDNFDIFQFCSLNKVVIENSGFYLDVAFSEGTRERIKVGDASFERDCGISGELRARYFPNCIKSSTDISYSSDEESDKIKLNVLVASNQRGKNLFKTSK